MFKWFMRVSVVVLCIASAWVNMPVVKVASGDVGTRNCRYVALGDSICRGYGLDDSSKQCYASLINQWLSQRYDYVFHDNLGEDGLESRELLSYLTDPSRKEYNKYTKTLKDADLVTVSIGSNDLMHLLNISGNIDEMISDNKEKFVRACRAFGETFPKIIRAIKKVAPDAVIVVGNVYNPCHGLESFQEVYQVADHYICELNQGYENVPDVLVADVFSAFQGSQEKLVNMAIRKDAIDPHPNARGHEIIAEKMLEKIQEEET